jgi:apolipoprotein N-acyltransferase
MPLRSAITPALIVAPWLERGLAVLALVAAAMAAVAARRSNRPTGERVLPTDSQTPSGVDVVR